MIAINFNSFKWNLKKIQTETTILHHKLIEWHKKKEVMKFVLAQIKSNARKKKLKRWRTNKKLHFFISFYLPGLLLENKSKTFSRFFFREIFGKNVKKSLKMSWRAFLFRSMEPSNGTHHPSILDRKISRK